MKAVQFLIVSLLLVSSAAFASDQAQKASAPSRGPGEIEEPGVPGTTFQCAYSIQKLGPSVLREGEYANYVVAVSNIGDCRLNKINVFDRASRELDIKDASISTGSCSLHDNKLECEIDDLRPGRVAFIDVKVQANNVHHDEWASNTACAFSRQIGIRICDSVNTLIRENHEHP